MKYFLYSLLFVMGAGCTYNSGVILHNEKSTFKERVFSEGVNLGYHHIEYNLVYKYNFLFKEKITRKEYNGLPKEYKERYYKPKSPVRYNFTEGEEYVLVKSNMHRNAVFNAYRFCKEKNTSLQGIILESSYVFALGHNRSYYVSCSK